MKYDKVNVDEGREGRNRRVSNRKKSTTDEFSDVKGMTCGSFVYSFVR